MGTKLANFHVLDGNIEQIRPLLPKEAQPGIWSQKFVSVYWPDFDIALNEKTAKAVSKKLEKTVLSAWLFDSDDIGLTVYQNGKSVAAHIMSPSGYSKAGNPAAFCETLGLPAEDAARLRVLWKKGDAEDQLYLTGKLLGLQLDREGEWLPEEPGERDEKEVDQWIAERPEPAKIKNETKAELLQELHESFDPNISAPAQGRYYTYLSEYAEDIEYKCYLAGADGKLYLTYNAEDEAFLKALKTQSITESYYLYLHGGDSSKSREELLAEYAGQPIFLPTGETLWWKYGLGRAVTLTLCAKDGSQIWQKQYDSVHSYFDCAAGEIIIKYMEDSAPLEYGIIRIDIRTGSVIEKLSKPFGLNAWSKAYHNGFWYVSHGGHFALQTAQVRQNTLTKFDGDFKPQAELPLPSFRPELFFSPDNALPGSVHLYAFFFEDKVLVINPDTLALENTLNEKSFLSPLGFDSAGRFWLRRDSSTVEAWDALLTAPRSRHKLKGAIIGNHTAGDGFLCAVTYSEKKKTLRVYKMQ
ncbi:MAG: hypothetical protein FWG66_10730 [Spirochaetes bacterium]|nr:hypothetical protein [Spirochaetota bacterium]